MTIYELFDNFLEQTVIGDKSFFDKKIDISSNIDVLIESYINNELPTDKYLSDSKTTNGFNHDDKRTMFQNKAMLQIGFLSKKTNGELIALKHLFASLLWLRYLPIFDTKPETKMSNIEYWIETVTDPKEIEKKAPEYFPSPSLATYGMAQQQIDQEIVELILLYKYLRDKIEDVKKNNSLQPVTIEKIKTWIINFIFDTKKCKTNFVNLLNQPQIEIKQESGKSGKEAELLWYKRKVGKHLAIHNMLLHLCAPTAYSSIAIQTHKENIVKKLYSLYVGKPAWVEIEKKNPYERLPVSEKKGIDFYIKEIIQKFLDKTDIKAEDWRKFWEPPIIDQWQDRYVARSSEILKNYQKQIILYGAPGTGKTYNAKKIIGDFIDKSFNNLDEKQRETELSKSKFNYTTNKRNQLNYKNDNDYSEEIIYELCPKLKDKKTIWEIVQFNQSFSYEDFIEGLKPKSNGSLKVEDGIFKTFANVAKENPEKYFILIIDEINRGKIDKIFGELLYLLEYRNESLKLHYSKTDFSIPENLYIIGTMNTADKSIALLDVALRRRFWFVRCAPQIDVLEDYFDVSQNDEVDKTDTTDNVKKMAIKLFKLLNDDKGILAGLGADADELKIGHSYFIKILKKDAQGQEIEPTFSDLKNIWFYSIIPLLEEYCGFNKEMLSGLFKNNSYKIDLSDKKNFTLDNLSKLK